MERIIQTYKMILFNKQNTKNLLKLADHIETVSPLNFNMRYLQTGGHTRWETRKELLEYDFSTMRNCALGHSLTIFPLQYRDLERWRIEIDFPSYARRVFHISPFKEEYEKMFSVSDKSNKEVAKDIRDVVQDIEDDKRDYQSFDWR